MSYHSEVHGIALFENVHGLNTALSDLEARGYIDSSSIEDNLDPFKTDKLVWNGETHWALKIPKGNYRNLGRNTELVLEPAVDGIIVGASNNVRWRGFVDTASSEYQEYALHEWLSEHDDPVDESDFEGSPETDAEWIESHVEAKMEREQAFMDYMITNSPYSDYLPAA